MRILIVRHADPEYHGDTLTPHGWKEAEALAAALCRNKDVGAGKLTRLFTSPMGRARDTARCTEKVSGLVAEVQEWTRELTYWPRMELEWNGRPDAGRGPGKGGEGGLAVWDVPGETVRSVAGVTAANEFESVRPVAGAKEPYAALCASSDAFLVALGYRREADGSYTIVRRNRDTIAVFCHGGFGLTWLAHLLGMPVSQVWSSFYLAPSSVTTVLFDERSEGKAVPRAVSVGETGHLYAAGLQTQVSKYEKPNIFSAEARPSGIKANFF